MCYIYISGHTALLLDKFTQTHLPSNRWINLRICESSQRWFVWLQERSSCPRSKQDISCFICLYNLRPRKHPNFHRKHTKISPRYLKKVLTFDCSILLSLIFSKLLMVKWAGRVNLEYGIKYLSIRTFPNCSLQGNYIQQPVDWKNIKVSNLRRWLESQRSPGRQRG